MKNSKAPLLGYVYWNVGIKKWVLLYSFFCANSTLKSELLKSLLLARTDYCQCAENLRDLFSALTAFFLHEFFFGDHHVTYYLVTEIIFKYWPKEILRGGLLMSLLLFVSHGWWHFLSTICHIFGYIQSFRLAWDTEDAVLKKNNKTMLSMDFYSKYTISQRWRYSMISVQYPT